MFILWFSFLLALLLKCLRCHGCCLIQATVAGRGGSANQTVRGMSLFQARDKIISDAEVVCSTLSSCISNEVLDIGTELKYDVSNSCYACAQVTGTGIVIPV